MREKFKAYYTDLVEGRKKGAPDALFSFFLLLFSFIYGFFVRAILSCYQAGIFKSYKPDCRVISVGNITWGGTGKTPLVETVVKFLKQEGKNPAILIRGYGKDEVYMLKDKFRDIPVIAGRDRIRTAKEAQERYGADTIILDDGFQHWRLKRDLDIVLIDATCPFGNRRLIPRGILREPLSSLTRADVFVLTKTDLAKENVESIKEELQKYNPGAPIYEAEYLPCFLRSLITNEKIELSAIKNQRIALLCGIANPQSFAKTLSLLGGKVSLSFYFPDHYQYGKEDLERIERQCLENQIQSIITTEKDAPRLSPLLKPERLRFKVLALCIELEIVKDKEKFFGSLLGLNNNVVAPFMEQKYAFLPNKHVLRGSGGLGNYSILILSDGRAGHLNQSKAVAGIIEKRKIDEGMSVDEVNTKIVEVKFKNGFCRVLLGFCSIFSNPNCRRCLACLRFCLEKGTFEELMQTPANIIVSAGSSLSAVNLFLSYKNKARKVILMKPSFLSLDRFDLVIVAEHDRLKRHKDNVLVTTIAPNLIDQQYLQEQANILDTRYEIRDTRYETNGPTIGVFIGGDTAKYRLTSELMNKIITQIKEATRNLNCQLLVTTSRRTPKMVEKLLKDNLGNSNQCKLLVIANEKNIPEAVGGILGLSDIIVVSGESISMVSEAISAEKYVLTFEPEKKVQAATKQKRFLEKLEKEGFVKIVQPDDLFLEIEKIWQEKPKKKKLEDKELIYQAISKIM